jgi:hypothetical protein
MVRKKSLLIAGAVTSIGLASATAFGQGAFAESNSTGGTSLVDRIAQTFHLDKNEVQKVFDADHEEHEAEHKARIEAKLDAAVKEGKLTEEQKSKILAKLEELKQDRPSREEMESKTPEQRRTEMEQHHQALQQWAKDNNIPEEYLPFGLKVRGPGPGGPGGGDVMFFEKKIES